MVAEGEREKRQRCERGDARARILGLRALGRVGQGLTAAGFDAAPERRGDGQGLAEGGYVWQAVQVDAIG